MRKARQGRRLRRVLVSLGVVLTLIVVAVGGYSFLLNQKVASNVQYDDLMPTADAVSAPARAETAKNAVNYLLVGTDARGGVDGGRSDVIILAHISDDRKSVHLIHFPRDLYVPIPGHGTDKLNSAYAYGGVPLLVKTLQNLVAVPIDHVALVDFEGFKRMTDAVGGVDVDNPVGSPDYPKGTIHLNGTDGLMFVRERHSLAQGDISRGQRQQAFIKAVMAKGLSREVLLNPLKLAGFVDAATSNLTVDKGLDIGEMRSLALEMRDLRGSDIKFVTAPWTGVGTAPNGASIVLVSQPQMARLTAALREDSLGSYVDNVSPKSGFGG